MLALTKSESSKKFILSGTKSDINFIGMGLSVLAGTTKGPNGEKIDESWRLNALYMAEDLLEQFKQFID